MKFKHYYKQIMLNEGGNAIENATSINKEDIQPTIDELSKEIFIPNGLNKSNWVFVGSTNKKTKSHDIDIAIKIAYDELEDILKKSKLQYKAFPGFGIFSIGYKIPNSNNIVQIDLIPTDDLQYTSFIYFSPSEKQSNYSGVERTELLKAIAHEIKHEILERFDDGEVKRESLLILSPRDGLVKAENSFVSPKTGARVKSKQNVKREKITKNVNEILKLLFGDSISEADVETYEDILALVKNPNFKWKNKQKQLLDYFNYVMERKQ